VHLDSWSTGTDRGAVGAELDLGENDPSLHTWLIYATPAFVNERAETTREYRLARAGRLAG
jgi:hypothetical protein